MADAYDDPTYRRLFGLPDPAPRGATLDAYTPTFSEKSRNYAQDLLERFGASRDYASSVGTGVGNLAAMTPPAAAYDAGRALGAGNYGEAAMDAVGAIPDVGTLAHGATLAAAPAAVAAKKAARSGLFDLSNLSRVPDVPQFDLPRYVPARGVPARVAELTSDRGVRDKVAEHIQSGLDMGGANWYNADPLRDVFVQQLGSDQGAEAFRKYMDFVAATSPRSDVGTNVRNASYYYQRQMSGQPMPEVGDRNPAPYGHMAQRLHQMNAQRVAGEGWDPLNNPKPASFVENLVGNQRPATIDTHAFRLPAVLAGDPRFLETAYQSTKDAPKQNIQKMVQSGDMSIDDARKTAAYWQAQPKENEYGAMERYYQGLAKDLGITPAQAQAAAWVGGGKVTGLASDSSKPFMGFFEDRVNLTAEKTGKTPSQVLKDFVAGKAPLLSVGGAGAVGAGTLGEILGSGQDQEPRQPVF